MRLNPKHNFADPEQIFWSDILSSASAKKFGISLVSSIIVIFRLLFSFYNLVFVFSFYNLVFCSPLLLHSGYL
jgi:hypothetical protein